MTSETIRKPKTRKRIEGESTVLDGRHRLSAQSLQVLVEYRNGNLIPADEVAASVAAAERKGMERAARICDKRSVMVEARGCAIAIRADMDADR